GNQDTGLRAGGWGAAARHAGGDAHRACMCMLLGELECICGVCAIFHNLCVCPEQHVISFAVRRKNDDGERVRHSQRVSVCGMQVSCVFIVTYRTHMMSS
ncbi:unnamed protein product, partial [Scytosiphon promiscuus]